MTTTKSKRVQDAGRQNDLLGVMPGWEPSSAGGAPARANTFGSATRTSAALPHPHGSLTYEALIARHDERRREERRRAMEHVAVRHGSQSDALLAYITPLTPSKSTS